MLPTEYILSSAITITGHITAGITEKRKQPTWSINLTAKGIYDKRMMKLLWQFRCKENPKNFECGLQDENYK
jgi:NAD dependent epimerase/dehydratase family enzyme